MTIAHRTGLAALAVALLVAALLLPPTVASASDAVDDGAFALVGTAHLSEGIQAPIADAPGCLGGNGVGGGTAAGGGVAAAAGVGNVGAQFTYNNTLTDGDAKGQIWIENLLGQDVNTNFDWLRVGATAVVTLHGNEDGVAVGLLVPADASVTACVGSKKSGDPINHGNPWPNDVHVQIVGVGVITS